MPARYRVSVLNVFSVISSVVLLVMHLAAVFHKDVVHGLKAHLFVCVCVCVRVRGCVCLRVLAYACAWKQCSIRRLQAQHWRRMLYLMLCGAVCNTSCMS
jgi:hypothetical protein